MGPNGSGSARQNRAPRRIQRRRTKGWRMPEGAVYVGRPSMAGNPFRIGDVVWVYRGGRGWQQVEVESAEHAVALFRDWLGGTLRVFERELAHLQGYLLNVTLAGCDLVCWCALDQPCHADVLLEIANARPGDAG